MSLEDQLNAEQAESWKPEPGDAIIGEVVGISTRDAGWGPYRLLTIKRDDGTSIAVHAFHDVLKQELAAIKPQIGHRIGIKYLGKPAGKNYAHYKVATENPPVEQWGDAEIEPPPSDLSSDFSEFSNPPSPVNQQPVRAGGSDDPPF